MATFKFVLNKSGMDRLLKGDAGDYVEQIARRRARPGMRVSRVAGATRANIRIEDPSSGALDREAKTGHLTGLLGD